MANGLEAKMIPTKVAGKNFGEKVMADRWHVVHTASGRGLLQGVSFKSQADADTHIAEICTAIPEADWSKSISELVTIPNLQVRLIEAGRK